MEETLGAQTLNRTPSFEMFAPNWSFHDFGDILCLAMGTSLYFIKQKLYRHQECSKGFGAIHE
jgi:hypothetical protein